MLHTLDRIQISGRTVFVWIVLALGAALFGCVPVNSDAPSSPVAAPAPVVPAAPAPAPPAQPVPLVVPGPPTRPFYMGFTLWPADLSEEGTRTAETFANSHGDIISIALIGGIPWPEALDGKTFSKEVQDQLNYRPPVGKKLLLSISPLDRNRRVLAPYWGEKDNLPLPKPWDKEPLNSPRIKKAYLHFLLRTVQTMRPDYLAIGVESNVLLTREPAKWRQFKELYRESYTALKKAYPTLPVFFTTDVLHYKKLTKEAKGTEQEREVAELMKHSDLFAMSLYPHMSTEVPRPVPGNFFEFATRFKKPIAVAESGMTSRNVLLKSQGWVLTGSDAEQEQFTELLLKTGTRDRYEFVINFATTDFDRLVARLRPPQDELASIWAFTGMQTGDKKPKPAQAQWDAYYRAKLVRVW
ncbi:MAG: glycosyl hydrolase 53 family protein [Candidatus Binatia bacterium]